MHQNVVMIKSARAAVGRERRSMRERARRRGGGEKKRTQLGDLLLHVGDSIVGRIELAHAGRPAATHRLPVSPHLLA